jgi:hypothetical protein
MDMIKLFGTSALLALSLAAAPASAQLLGGGGGLGGGLGGLGGHIGGSGMGTLGGTIDAPMRRLPSTSNTTSSVRGASRTEKKVDARQGHVSASNDSAFDSTVANSSRLGDHAIGGSGAASGTVGGSADAQLIGTDALRGTATNAVGRTRDAASTVRDRAGTTTGRVRDAAGNAASRTRDTAGNALSGARNAVPSTNGASAAGSGAASGMGALDSGTLALAGSAAASGSGAFPVAVGMPVTDAKGRLIGTVQSVRTAAQGGVEQVLVKVKDKTATLPAANFTGSGNALISAMGKGEINQNAE